jgi:hypothetical protein
MTKLRTAINFIENTVKSRKSFEMKPLPSSIIGLTMAEANHVLSLLKEHEAETREKR